MLDWITRIAKLILFCFQDIVFMSELVEEMSRWVLSSLMLSSVFTNEKADVVFPHAQSGSFQGGSQRYKNKQQSSFLLYFRIKENCQVCRFCNNQAYILSLRLHIRIVTISLNLKIVIKKLLCFKNWIYFFQWLDILSQGVLATWDLLNLNKSQKQIVLQLSVYLQLRLYNKSEDQEQLWITKHSVEKNFITRFCRLLHLVISSKNQ